MNPGCLIKLNTRAVNKIGHALHDIDPCFGDNGTPG